MTSRYSEKSCPYFMTMTCALTPSTFCLNDCWKPEVTDSTTTSASTPMVTPMIETAVKPEKTLSSRKKRKSRIAGSARLVPTTCASPCEQNTAAERQQRERAEDDGQRAAPPSRGGAGRGSARR